MLLLPPIAPANRKPVYNVHDLKLGDSTFRLRLRWSDRASSWYLEVYDADDELLVAGVRMVIGAPLCWRLRDERLPKGYLRLVDTSGSGRECGYDDLGVRCKLFFFARAELQPAATSSITVTAV